MDQPQPTPPQTPSQALTPEPPTAQKPTRIPNLLRTPALKIPATDADTSPSSASFERRRSLKLLAFDIFAVLFSGATGYAALLYFSGSGSFWFLVAASGIFLLASFFDFLFDRSPKRRALSMLLQIAAFLVFFYDVKWSVLLTAFGVMAILYFFADHSARAASENSLKFHLWPVARAYIKKVFIGFALGAIILYLPQWNSGNIFVPQPQFQGWYNEVAVVASHFYSGIDFNASVEAFAQSVARVELSGNGVFRALPQSAQDVAVRTAADGLIATAGKGLGFTLQPDASVANAFYQYIVNLLTHFKNEFGSSFLAVWAIALFAIVWSIGTIVIWVLSIIAYLLFELFAAFNIARIAGETRTKEVVELA